LVLDEVLGPDAATRTLGERLCWCARAELALARDEPARALSIVDRLLADAVTSEGPGERTIPHLGVVRGRALMALRRPAEAEVALLSAEAGAFSREARPLLRRIQALLGRLYRAQGRRADAERVSGAAWALVEAQAAAVPDAALHETFLRQATAMLPHPHASPRPETEAAGGLSVRERDVAVLIAQGRTNGEIAAALSIGKRTVETHVGNILAKSGCTTRAQLVAWLLARGPARPAAADELH
jgi:DNA-binding CsgD family transcriptional regulator